jgi:hypothetical protein
MAKEISHLAGINILEYLTYYPDYFKDELKRLHDSKKSAEDGFFFRLNLDVPSPLAWLLLNEPQRFLLACEKCIVEYKKELKNFSTGKRDRLEPEEQRAIMRIKEEIESYLLDINLYNYQAILQQEIARRYIDQACLMLQEEQDDYQAENIDPFVREHNWMFDKKVFNSIENRIQELFTAVKNLYDLLQQQGRFEVMLSEDGGGRF